MVESILSASAIGSSYSKLWAHNTGPRSLDGERSDVFGYPNPHLAALVCSNQTIADAHAANRRLPPVIIGDQEFSLDLDRAVVQLQLSSVGFFAHGHTRVDRSLHFRGSLPSRRQNLPATRVTLFHALGYRTRQGTKR